LFRNWRNHEVPRHIRNDLEWRDEVIRLEEGARRRRTGGAFGLLEADDQGRRTGGNA
jgi:hypothetical protein